MSFERRTQAEIVEVCRLWVEYQRRNDVSARVCQAVAIDPRANHIWFGESAIDIGRQIEADRIDAAILIDRIGSPAYFIKVGKRIRAVSYQSPLQLGLHRCCFGFLPSL
jgi:hypothetical protein